MISLILAPERVAAKKDETNLKAMVARAMREFLPKALYSGPSSSVVNSY